MKTKLKGILLLFLVAATFFYKIKDYYRKVQKSKILETKTIEVIIISATSQFELKTNNRTSISLADRLEQFLINFSKYSKGQKINLNVITNEQEIKAMTEVINVALENSTEISYEFYSLKRISEMFQETISMSRNISGSKVLNRKSADITWHIKCLYPKIFSYKKAIALDIDIAFRSHFNELYKQFEEMNPEQIMGLAYNQNQLYRMALRDYRLQNPGTGLGNFPPGFPGFNDGVMLLDLQKMRESEEFNYRLTQRGFLSLFNKYNLNSSLGCNDYYTLMGAEYPQLFYILDCSFNRLTAITGFYHPLFYKYYRCDQDVKIYHGASNSPIPSEYIDP